VTNTRKICKRQKKKNSTLEPQAREKEKKQSTITIRKFKKNTPEKIREKIATLVGPGKKQRNCGGLDL